MLYDVSSTSFGTAYGLRSLLNAIGSSYPRWNLYVDGTAPNYLAGGLSLGDSTYTTAVAAKLTFATATNAAGGINFGGGLSNLYRSAADTLKTDGNFIVGGSMTFSGGTSFGGALNLNYGTVQTTNYAVAASDCVIPVNSSAGAVTITLTAVTAAQKGRLVIVKDVGGSASMSGKNIVVSPNGSNKIDGVNASVAIDGDRYSFMFVCNGVDGWDII